MALCFLFLDNIYILSKMFNFPIQYNLENADIPNPDNFGELEFFFSICEICFFGKNRWHHQNVYDYVGKTIMFCNIAA